MRVTRARSRRSQKIDNVDTSYYIGYCEDEETPDAIMQKFAALERLQMQHQREKFREQGFDSDGEEKEPIGDLPEKYFKQLFEETTMFAVDDVIEATPQYAESYHVDEYGVWEIDGEMIADSVSEWSESDWSDDTKVAKPSNRKANMKRNHRKRVAVYDGNISVGPSFRAHVLCNMPVRKLKDVRYQRCPPLPLVPSYCHMILPYKEPVPTAFLEADVFNDDLTHLLKGNKVFGIYLNLPWIYHDPDHKQTKSLWTGFQKIKYPDSLIELGLIFAYIPKFLFADAVKVMKAKGFKWVEKALVIERDFGRIVGKKSKFLEVAKMSLHIFRKIKKGQVPMQHQRVTNAHLLSGEDKMHYTYNLIEEMLPPNLKGQKNVRLLELHDVGEKREGWIQILHKQGA